MSTATKIALAIVATLAVLLAVNALVLNDQTKGSGVTIDGGRVIELPGGDVQIFEQGPVLRSATGGRIVPGAPIVLIHCHACSLHWYDRLAPLLARRHRVVRLDLLGHGGSEKPASGYSIPEQAALVAGALDDLDVQGAVVVGHSMGFTVATALAERATQLVDRLVNIGEGPSPDQCDQPFVESLTHWPVIGEAAWRIAPDFAVRDGYESAVAPGYDLDAGFIEDDQVLLDRDAMTISSFTDAHDANEDFRDEVPLNERLQQIAVPLMSIFGAEDQVCDPRPSQDAYRSVPGARLETVKRAGHSPNVEKPAETATLIEQFAAGAAVAKPRAPERRRPRRR